MPSDITNEFRPGDSTNNILKKILDRLLSLIGAVETVTPTIIIDPGEVEIGSVSLKDGVGAALATVVNSAPVGSEQALVTRNIPSGTQTVTGTVNVGNLPATQPVSGTVNVGNFPATQPVSGSVAVTNFPATQPVSGTVTVTGSVSVSNFPATQPVSGTVTVGGTVAVSNFPSDYANPVFDAARVGAVGGKAAESFHVMGRRAGFNSTAILQDVAEFLGTSIDALPELTGVENLEVVSSSVNDTNGGSGANSIRVGYIDTSNNLVESADILLSGTTPVALAFKSKFILWMETSAVGANTVAAGNIILRIVGPGATQEQITAGGNRSLSCRFMVPTGYTGYLVDWGVWSIGNATQDVRLRATVHSGARSLGTAYIFQSTAYMTAGSNGGEELPYLVCPALSKIKVSTFSGATANTNRIDAEFTILLIAN